MDVGDSGGYLKNYKPGHNWVVKFIITGGYLDHNCGAGEPTLRA